MDKNRSANPNIKEFVGRKRPVTQVMVVAVFVPQLILMFKWWGKMSGSHIGIMLVLMVMLLLIVLKVAPRFEPQKKIRFGQNTLAMYQDEAIHWHIPYSDIDRFTINRREHLFLNRANMLNVFNGAGDQLIEQDVEFLSADQRTELLGLMKERCCSA
ncbi:hypothetical protein [Pseudoteredinibacter isoporae]|uniref:Uncharacterized protein n=1 Tax=Pseudoteredinibacter isoporae TaxID=570281 RepID=A0A7X0JQ91_9GAMM|nr:hypothetical protein [Pseudoteredinibacter isoporae]MBB6520302.1 hypothetical protein [Pseudoteredinibacter isoporae]NHO85873.1 hypothetical protein [Pseudoteredinibacter isoporae]NIB25675.1 hypothetical protein [Pseudoteredinibacter isoporae]